jgi:hypothetical protein
MAQKAREAIGDQKLRVIADRGYFKNLEILACEQAGIATYVPKPMTSNSKAEGRFSKLDFVYIAKDDEYRCPAGQRLAFHHSTVEHEMNINVYWTSACSSCPLKASARRAMNDASGAGSTRRSSTSCRRAWTASPMR